MIIFEMKTIMLFTIMMIKEENTMKILCCCVYISDKKILVSDFFFGIYSCDKNSHPIHPWNANSRIFLKKTAWLVSFLFDL